MAQGILHICSAEAIRTFLQQFAPLAAEDVSLLEGLEGRVLAQDIPSADTVPFVHRAGTDGYALRSTDTLHASESTPIHLTCIEQCSIAEISRKALEPGQCIRLAVGGVLPPGADAVIRPDEIHSPNNAVEPTHLTPYPPPHGEHAFTPYNILITKPVTATHNIIPRGEDAQFGACLLEEGTLLRPQEIALLASAGVPDDEVDLDRIVHGIMKHTVHVLAHKKPQVAIISTGDEVVSVHGSLEDGKVRDVNSHLLAAMIREAGGMSRFHGIVPDAEEKIAEVIERALLSSADVVCITGGSSESAHELTLKAIQSIPKRHGIELFCRGAHMIPGQSLILAKVGNKSIWGLPGQVSAVQAIMHTLGQPFLLHLQGIKNAFAYENALVWKHCHAILAEPICTKRGYEEHVRVRLELNQDKQLLAFPVYGLSGLLRTMTTSQGLVHMPAQESSIKQSSPLICLEKGAVVRVLLFN